MSVLTGAAGGTQANLSRWCRQMGREPLSADEIAELPRLPMLGVEGTLLRVAGTYRGMGGAEIADAVMLGVICPPPEETVFVRMIGPESEVAPQEERFEAFCRSLR